MKLAKGGLSPQRLWANRSTSSLSGTFCQGHKSAMHTGPVSYALQTHGAKPGAISQVAFQPFPPVSCLLCPSQPDWNPNKCLCSLPAGGWWRPWEHFWSRAAPWLVLARGFSNVTTADHTPEPMPPSCSPTARMSLRYTHHLSCLLLLGKRTGGVP